MELMHELDTTLQTLFENPKELLSGCVKLINGLYQQSMFYNSAAFEKWATKIARGKYIMGQTELPLIQWDLD